MVQNIESRIRPVGDDASVKDILVFTELKHVIGTSQREPTEDPSWWLKNQNKWLVEDEMETDYIHTPTMQGYGQERQYSQPQQPEGKAKLL